MKITEWMALPLLNGIRAINTTGYPPPQVRIKGDRAPIAEFRGHMRMKNEPPNGELFILPNVARPDFTVRADLTWEEGWGFSLARTEDKILGSLNAHSDIAGGVVVLESLLKWRGDELLSLNGYMYRIR